MANRHRCDALCKEFKLLVVSSSATDQMPWREWLKLAGVALLKSMYDGQVLA